MGVTIHFEGRLKGEQAYERVIASAKVVARDMGWSVKEISETHTTLKRVKNQETWDYTGPSKGVQFFPHEYCEPLRLEFDRDYYIQEHVKTQFAPIEIHVLVCEFLHAIEHEFEQLIVDDEGEYYKTANVNRLAQHIDKIFDMLKEYLEKDDKYYGPIRLDNGRIIDVMGKDSEE